MAAAPAAALLPTKQQPQRYVAGDVGGTNARLVLIERSADGEEKEVMMKVYASRDYPHLTVILDLFLHEATSAGGARPRVAVLAVAGPVLNNTCRLSNLNWHLDGAQMAKVLGLDDVRVLNDFCAVGFGLLALGPADLVQLNPGVKPVANGVKACLGAGTGLGEVFLTHNGREYDVQESEGGHGSFAPRNETEMRLFRHFLVSERLPRVSIERVVSGSAIPKIYNFLRNEYPALINAKTHAEIRRAKDAAAVISRHAQARSDELCVETMDLFVKAYGAEAGDLALKVLPFGGLYVAGGIAPKILDLLREQDKFLDNMVSKGRMRSLLEKIPVYVVRVGSVGLLGSRVVAARILDAAPPRATAKL